MTREEIAEDVMRVGGSHYACERLADAVRALPVIATCGECDSHYDDADDFEDALGVYRWKCARTRREIDVRDAPPGWCPLRRPR